MQEHGPELKLYIPDESPEGDFSSRKEAVAYMRDVVRQFEEKEIAVTRENATKANMETYAEQAAQRSPALPRNDREHFLRIVANTRSAVAFKELLKLNGVEDWDNSMLSPDDPRKKTAQRAVALFAEAEQSVVSLALKHAKDPDLVSDIVYTYALLSETKPGVKIEKTRHTVETPPEQGQKNYMRERIYGACRGVTGHVAAINLVTQFAPNEYKAFSPNAILDSAGLDFVLCSRKKGGLVINFMFQVKASKDMNEGLSVKKTGDAGEELSRLQKLTRRMKAQWPESISPTVKEIVLEIRSLEDYDQSGKESGFDVLAGTCNDALLAEAKALFLETELFEKPKPKLSYDPTKPSPLSRHLKKQAS